MRFHKDKEHDFFEIIAGREKGNLTAETFRAALQEEAKTIKEAEKTQPLKLPEYEMVRLNAIKNELIKNGVFIQKNDAAPSWLSSIFDKFKSTFISESWKAGLAISASVLIVSTILLQQPSRDSHETIQRQFHLAQNKLESKNVGQEPNLKMHDFNLPESEKYAVLQSNNNALTLLENDPHKAATDLRDKIIAVGANAKVVQIDDNEWTVAISVPEKSKTDAVKREIEKVLMNKTIINDDVEYHISILKTKNADLEGSQLLLNKELINKVFKDH